MNYGKLVTAIKNGAQDQKELDLLYTKTFKALCTYLQTTMRACVPDAEECAQHALIKTMERIQKNAIREPESIYLYLLRSAKNKYLRVLQERTRSNYQDDMEPYLPIEEQIDALVNYEEQEALEECLEKLPDESREFINCWFKYPDTRAKDVALSYGISVNNVWIKKHRIIKQLSECVQKKLDR